MPEWNGEGMAPEVDRDQLILDHLPLLKHIAGRMTFDPSGAVDREDIQGFGMLGLVEAAESWDPTRGLKFSTYAYPRIRGAILDELRRQDFLPRGRRERVRELEAALDKHVKEHGHPPAPEELAELLASPLDEIDEILCSAHSALSTSIDGESEVLAAMLTDPRSEDPVGSAEWEEMTKGREWPKKPVSGKEAAWVGTAVDPWVKGEKRARETAEGRAWYYLNRAWNK